MKDSFGSAKDTKKKLIWAVLFLIIAALSVFAVKSASREFSFKSIRQLLSKAHPLYISLAFAAMIGFILFEGLALRVLVKSFGHACSVKDCISYSAADIYFSAITPSATGGQPASAYFMIKSGIPASCTTVCLIFNLALYTLAIIIIGLITVILAPGVYLFFRPVARVLIALGAVTLIGIATLFVLLVKKRSLIEKLGRIVIGIGCRFRIIKDRFLWNEKLAAWSEEYMQYASMIGAHKAAIAKALILNVLQRTCQLSVTMFMYIATNINVFGANISEVFKNGARLLGAQSFISIGATYVPIPGAMGFTDLMMLDGFRTLMPEAQAAGLELLSRFVSFYSCVIICFVITITTFIIRRKEHE